MLKSWCEFILLIYPNYAVGPHAVKYTCVRTREGRADIWYMCAMINRLIRKGFIKLTLHIKSGSTHDDTFFRLEHVRDWMRMSSSLHQSAGPQPICPAVIRAIILSDQRVAKLLAETWLFISIRKELRQRAGAALFKGWHPIPLCHSNWLLVRSAALPSSSARNMYL